MRTWCRDGPRNFFTQSAIFQKSVLCKILDSLVIVMDATEVNDGNYR